MRQGAFYTYPVGEKLEHTSMWMTPRSREWLQETAKRSGLSQALVVDTLIRAHILNAEAMTPNRFTTDYCDELKRVNDLLSFIQA